MLRIKGVSKNIDGCSGLIAQAANRTYYGLPNNHKRWMDPEDLIQEGLAEAVGAERRWKRTGGAKYSSYLYEGLKFRYAHIRSAVLTEKRSTRELLELDKPPIEGVASGIEVPEAATQGQVLNAVQSFVTLCRSVSQPAVLALIRGFVFGDGRYFTEAALLEVRAAAGKLHISIADLRPIGKDEKIREKLLTELSEHVMLEMETEVKLRCLECVECRGQHSLESVREGRFFVSVMTCRGCLAARAQSGACFGKSNQPGRVGYSTDATECRLHCQDRQLCQKIIRGEIEMEDEDEFDDDETELNGEEESDPDGALDDEEVDLTDLKGKTTKAKAAPKKAKGKKVKAKGKTKAGKKAVAPVKVDPKKDKGKTAEAPVAKGKKGKKKAPKVPAKKTPAKRPATVEDPDPAPKEVVVWPHKRGSMMREIFKMAYKGCLTKELEKVVVKAGRNWKFMLFQLRTAYFRGNRTHLWKLNEDGARLKVYDVKYLGGE